LSSATATCCACGRPDVLGLGLCPECGSAGQASDSLVFLRRTAARSDRHTTGQRLAGLIGDRTDTADGRATIRGDQPLVRIPPAVAPFVVDSLERKGIPTRTIAMKSAWMTMPSHFFLMILSITVLGAMAGVSGVPEMLVMSPVLAGLLLVAAQRSMTKPLIRAPQGDAMPAAVEAAAMHAFSRLAAAKPRELLADLVGIARPLMRTLRAEGDPAGLAVTLDELIIAACATALETDHLAQTASVVRDEVGAGSHESLEGDMLAAADRCDGAAAMGTRRLVEAVGAVADISGRTALDPGAADRLARLAQELRTGSGYRDDALREIDRLLIH
jgi:hypothetical protein